MKIIKPNKKETKENQKPIEKKQNNFKNILTSNLPKPIEQTNLENVEDIMKGMLIDDEPEEKGSVTFEITLTKKQFKKWIKLGGIRWLRAMLVNKSAKSLMKLKKEIGQTKEEQNENNETC